MTKALKDLEAMEPAFLRGEIKTSRAIAEREALRLLQMRSLLVQFLRKLSADAQKTYDQAYEEWFNSCLCEKIARRNGGYIGEKNQSGACMQCRMSGGHNGDGHCRHCDENKGTVSVKNNDPDDRPIEYHGRRRAPLAEEIDHFLELYHL